MTEMKENIRLNPKLTACMERVLDDFSAKDADLSPDSTAKSPPSWLGVPVENLVRVLKPEDYEPLPLTSLASHIICSDLLKTDASLPIRFQYIYDNHILTSFSAPFRLYKLNNSSDWISQDSTPAFPKRIVTRWEIIEESITRTYKSVSEFGAAKAVYADPSDLFPDVVSSLTECIDQFPAQEASYFLDSLLPFIAHLVTDLPSVFSEPIPFLKCGMNSGITFSQKQIAHLLAGAFFCVFPERSNVSANEPGYPHINFDRLFWPTRERTVRKVTVKIEKLKCIINYFHRVKNACPTGNVTFERRALDVFPDWKNCPATLSKVHITHKGRIEDGSTGCLQVVFANRFVGGGVLNEGCDHEEIQFIVNPELIISRLFTQALQPNEALIITGPERFSNYSGFGPNFTFTGEHVDSTPFDALGRRLTKIVAMDSFIFNSIEDQYQQEYLVRELNKAFVGFVSDGSECPPRCVAAGNWGCGAFGRHVTLKFILLLLACSLTERDMMFFTFADADLQEELYSVYECFNRARLTIGDVFRILTFYHVDVILEERMRVVSLCRFLKDYLTS